MYSDSDSLSYNSLSRSSSLIQFESLERQLLQNESGVQQQQQTFSGSTPILGGSSLGESSTLAASKTLSDFERMLCRKNTNNLLQNGSSGGRQVIPGVVVVDADEDNHRNEDDSSDNSDSSGVDESTNSSFSSEESYYLNHSSDKNSEDDDEELNGEEEIIKVGNRNIGVVSVCSSGVKTQGCVNGNVIAFSRRFSGSSDNTNNASGSVSRNIVSVSSNSGNNNVRNKNSVESLSEDSGFCDQSISNSLRRVKSKSNPSLNVLDNGHFSVNAILNESVSRLNDDDICCKSMEDLSNNCAAMETRNKNNNRRTTTTTKIVESRRTDSKNNSQNSVSEQRHTTTTQRQIIIVNSQQEKVSRQKRVKSSSSPELRSSSAKTKKNKFSVQSYIDDETSDNRDDLFHVSSVPNDLYLCGDPGSISSASYNNSYNKISSDSIATHNVNLFHLNSPISTPSVIPINPSLTASYANLTLLNYSDQPTIMATGNNSASDLLSNRKYSTGGPDTARSEFSSLLEEITAHFDRNLSILNDQHETYEPSIR